MADYFTLFSATVPDLVPQEREWATQLLDPDCSETTFAHAGLTLDLVDRDDWPGFEWEFVEPQAHLWIGSHESGKLDHVAAFVSAFLRRFRPKQGWGMTWAETCSKPRIEDFGGGGVFVTATSVTFFTPRGWLDQQRRNFELGKH